MSSAPWDDSKRLPKKLKNPRSCLLGCKPSHGGGRAGGPQVHACHRQSTSTFKGQLTKRPTSVWPCIYCERLHRSGPRAPHSSQCPQGGQDHLQGDPFVTPREPCTRRDMATAARPGHALVGGKQGVLRWAHSAQVMRPGPPPRGQAPSQAQDRPERPRHACACGDNAAREPGAAVRMASVEATWPGGFTGVSGVAPETPFIPQPLIHCAAWGPEGAAQPVLSKGE